MVIQNKQYKQNELVMYTVLYRLFLMLLVVGLLSFLIGLFTGMSGWSIGYTFSVLGCLLAFLIMPFYLIYRTRYNKARLVNQLRKRYNSERKEI